MLLAYQTPVEKNFACPAKIPSFQARPALPPPSSFGTAFPLERVISPMADDNAWDPNQYSRRIRSRFVPSEWNASPSFPLFPPTSACKASVQPAKATLLGKPQRLQRGLSMAQSPGNLSNPFRQARKSVHGVEIPLRTSTYVARSGPIHLP